MAANNLLDNLIVNIKESYPKWKGTIEKGLDFFKNKPEGIQGYYSRDKENIKLKGDSENILIHEVLHLLNELDTKISSDKYSAKKINQEEKNKLTDYIVRNLVGKDMGVDSWADVRYKSEPSEFLSFATQSPGFGTPETYPENLTYNIIESMGHILKGKSPEKNPLTSPWQEKGYAKELPGYTGQSNILDIIGDISIQNEYLKEAERLWNTLEKGEIRDKALNIINDFTNAPQTLYDEWLKGEREDYKQDLLKNPVLFNKETYPFSDAIKYQPRYNN